MSKTLKFILKIVGCLVAIAGITYLVMTGFEQIRQFHFGCSRPEEYDDYADVD